MKALRRAFCTSAMIVAFATTAPVAAQQLPAKGEPPLSAHTRASGLPLTPEQQAMAFTHADLSFEIWPDRHAISGIAALTFRAKAPLSALVVDLDQNLPVSAIALDGKTLSASAWSQKDGQIRITLPAPLAKGKDVTATIRYAGQPHVAVKAPWDGGFVWSETKDGQPWIATAVEGEGCDLFWPCIDHPTGEPALVDLRITVPKGLSAPANGVLIGVDRLKDGRSTWHWRTHDPNTYAIALDVGPYGVIKGSYKSRYGNSIPLEMWYIEGNREKAQQLFDEFAPTLDFFEAKIGPYPFGDEKVGVVETPHLGMEHQTINAYGNDYKKAPEGFDWLFQHEFGHEWFGNQLTNSNWDHYWLHEGYDTLMQPLYGEWRRGDMLYKAMLWGLRSKIANEHPVVSGSPKTEEQVYLPDQGPGQDIYNKGAWMLHTLRMLIGDDQFFDITRRIVYGRPDPKPGNFQPRFADTDEYVRIVNQVTGKDYGWFFDAYLRHAPLPDLITTRDGDRMTLRWKVEGDGPFPLPVEVAVDGKVTRLPMTDGAGSLAVPANAHVVIDPEMKILRRAPDIEAYRAWDEARRTQQATAKE